MDKQAFYRLLDLIKPHLPSRYRPRRTGGTWNGEIPADTKLSVVLRFFAAGDPLDITISHGISHSCVYESIWQVVDAVNQCENLAIRYPTSHETQKEIAEGFSRKSDCSFNNCAGAIDGMLVWVTKPTQSECEAVQIGPKKFYCVREKIWLHTSGGG